MKKPNEHWLKAKDLEDQIRLMILEGYELEQIVKFGSVKKEFAENIAEKYGLNIRTAYSKQYEIFRKVK